MFCALPNAQPNHGEENFKTIRLPEFRSLLLRLLFSHIVVLYKCLRIRPDLVHIFVPELIPVAFVFKWLGARVVYEVQENLYKKFSIKTYNNAWMYRTLFSFFDHSARKHFALIFTEDAYLYEYDKLAHPATIVRNYALPSFIDTYPSTSPLPSDNPEIIYMGVISLERSFDTVVVALATLKKCYPGFKMHLFGSLRIAQEDMEKLPGYDEIAENLTFYGYTDQKKIFGVARNAVAGIALLKPVADYPESYTTKLFEYMSLRIPVITSDFALYRNVVEQSGCGFCISPYKADMLSKTLQWLIENPGERIRMGKNGREAVEEKYNWASEEATLLAFYRTLLKN